MTSVFSQSVSLTQTSFTSECQNAKSKGVQVIFLAMDGSATARMATSCAALDYYPSFAGPGIAISATQSRDPKVQKNGAYLAATVAPFTTSDLPGTKLFQQALQRYGAGQAIDQSVIEGWTSGRMFEAALNAVGSELRNRAVTTADVMTGLYKFKKETLGGLAPPLTFTKGQPSPIQHCYWAIGVKEGGFFAPFGSERFGKC